MIAVWVIGGFIVAVLSVSCYFLWKVTRISPEAKKYLEKHPD